MLHHNATRHQSSLLDAPGGRPACDPEDLRASSAPPAAVPGILRLPASPAQTGTSQALRLRDQQKLGGAPLPLVEETGPRYSPRPHHPGGAAERSSLQEQPLQQDSLPRQQGSSGPGPHHLPVLGPRYPSRPALCFSGSQKPPVLQPGRYCCGLPRPRHYSIGPDLPFRLWPHHSSQPEDPERPRVRLLLNLGHRLASATRLIVPTWYRDHRNRR